MSRELYPGTVVREGREMECGGAPSQPARKPRVEIEASERAADYWIDSGGARRKKFHAQVKGSPGYWDCGRSVAEAVGNLVLSHPEQFGAKVVYVGAQSK